ncbi:hypothetical protein [Rhodococcus erythropolis]|uniref:hypothetical protein n=1 Tax=Rhodococcus erythropolis TaxID=1833 RepID=UPI0008AB202E|nr:hypothetical protein [Rhodococcus erythropolis]OFV73517.1 hypothetical protein RERY_58430 [Rhodococcus erythropolis]
MLPKIWDAARLWAEPLRRTGCQALVAGAIVFDRELDQGIGAVLDRDTIRAVSFALARRSGRSTFLFAAGDSEASVRPRMPELRGAEGLTVVTIVLVFAPRRVEG